VTIHPAILQHYPHLNDAQRAVVGHLNGPLLVVAGPGSGKTYSLILRAVNLLLLNQATPGEVILCTFTEKAAFEMRDRLASAARKVGYDGDLLELTVATIHGLCNGLLQRYRHRTRLSHSYETLDELTQLLFLFDHFDEIIGRGQDGSYLGRWHSRWAAIEGARDYFDKITEELIDPQALQNSQKPFLRALRNAYLAYQRAPLAYNRVDFAHFNGSLRSQFHTFTGGPWSIG